MITLRTEEREGRRPLAAYCEGRVGVDEEASSRAVGSVAQACGKAEATLWSSKMQPERCGQQYALQRESL